MTTGGRCNSRAYVSPPIILGGRGKVSSPSVKRLLGAGTSSPGRTPGERCRPVGEVGRTVPVSHPPGTSRRSQHVCDACSGGRKWARQRPPAIALSRRVMSRCGSATLALVLRPAWHACRRVRAARCVRHGRMRIAQVAVQPGILAQGESISLCTSASSKSWPRTVHRAVGRF